MNNEKENAVTSGLQLLISKLGHPLEEIRVRSLLNISSKIEYGIITDDDLIVNNQILPRLLKWFDFPSQPEKDAVLKLILKLAKTTLGKEELINHEAFTYFTTLKTRIETKHHRLIDDILELFSLSSESAKKFINNLLELPAVSNQNDILMCRNPNENSIDKRPEVNCLADKCFNHSDSSNIQCNAANFENTSVLLADLNYQNDTYFTAFPWIPLNSSDRHVLVSTNESLQNNDAKELSNLCKFLQSILFQDFPTEIFLQRPEILFSLLKLIKQDADPFNLCTEAIDCLLMLTSKLIARIQFYCDPTMGYSRKSSTALSAISTSRLSSPNSYHTVKVTDIQDQYPESQDDFTEEDLIQLQLMQITVQEFVIQIMKTCLPLSREILSEPLTHIIQLMHSVIDLLELILNSNIEEKNDLLTRNDGISDIFNLLTSLLCHHQMKFRTLENVKNVHLHRLVYLCIANLTIRILRTTIMSSQVKYQSICHPLMEALTPLLFDASFYLCYSQLHSVLIEFISEINNDVIQIYKETLIICESMKSTNEFLQISADVKINNDEKILNCAENGLLSLTYNKFTTFIQSFIQFLSKRSVNYLNNGEENNLERGRIILIKLLQHSSQVIRMCSLRTCLALIKRVLNTSSFSSAKALEASRISFLFDSRFIRFFCEFGLLDDNEQIAELTKDVIICLLQSRRLIDKELWCQLLNSICANLSVVQGFADSTSSLGRAIAFLTDFETSLLNKLELLRGTIRLMFTSDHQLRCNTLANLAWFLTSESNSKGKLPSLVETELSERPNLLIPSLDQKYIALRTNVLSYEFGNLKNILDIAATNDMEIEIKKSALGQLPFILEDTRLHSYFIEHGLACLKKLIDSGLLKDSNMPEILPVCFHSLMILVVHNPELRETLSCDYQIYLNLLRGALLFNNEAKTHLHVCVTISLLLFKDDFIEYEKIPPVEGGDAAIERVFTVPLAICNRYKLPLKVIPSLETLPISNEDNRLYHIDHAKQMLKMFWNIYYHGDIAKFSVESLENSENVYSSVLNATPNDQQIVIATHLRSLFEKSLNDMNEASSHRQVRQILVFLRLLVIASRSNDYAKQFISLSWQDSFAKFLHVSPLSTADKKLLKLIIDFFIFLLSENFIALSEDLQNWLTNSIFSSSSAVYFTLSNQTVDIDAESRSLSSKLIRFVSATLRKCRMKGIGNSAIGDIVLFVLQALSVSEASQFYNLASLQIVIRCLMHLTYTSGWSVTCTKATSVELCAQVLSALMDVIIAFHVGVGKSNNSLMGKGVTFAATVTLQHLICEMKLQFESEKWVELWLSQNQRLTNTNHMLGLMWLVPLWIYRDEEVRSASLCIAVGLSENSTGCLTLMSNLEHISGGIWGAAFSFLLDPNEVTCVKEQAALLLVNLTGHLIADGSRNVIAPNLSVKDSSTNELLIGVDALRALLHLSNFYQNLIDLISRYARQPFGIQIQQTNRGNEILSISSNATDFSFDNLSMNSPETLSSNLDTLTNNSESLSIGSLMTPGLICNLCKLIQNLLILVPDETFDVLNSEILELLICSLDLRRIIYYSKSSSLLYAGDILQLYRSIVTLVCICIVKNQSIGEHMGKHSEFMQSLIDLLDIQMLGITIITKEDVYWLWSDIYKLFWLLLTMENPQSIVIAHLSRHCLRLMGNIILMLEHSANEEQWLNCLKFFTAYSKSGHKIAECLDDPTENLCVTNEEIRTVGSVICQLLFKKYGIIFNKSKQDFMNCGIVTNAFSSLLALSYTAKITALQCDLIKREIKHLKDIYVGITLASLDNIKLSASKKMEIQWQQSLIIHFDLLQCFLHNCQDAKIQSSQFGLSGILHQLWCWCLQTPLVVLSLLSLLCTYTANCKTSIRSVAYTSAVQGAGTVKTLGVHSLVHAVIRLAQNEIDRINNTRDITLSTLVFQSLTNMSLGSECRSIVCKTNFLDGFTKLNIQQTKKHKHQLLIDGLWLHFLLSLTFHSDGQDAFVRLPGAIDLLLEFVGTGSSVSAKACQVLRNLCCSTSANKSFLLNSDRVIRALIAFLKTENIENQSIAASALWGLTANCQKAKTMLRNVSLMAQLQQVCLECDNSDDSILTAKYLRQVLDLCQIDT